MSEIWKDIPGFEGCYQASNLGKIKSLPGGKRKSRILNTANKIKNSGYHTVNLWKNGKQITKTVHKCVISAFYGIAEGLEVNHKNDNKLDNRLSNLEWTTRALNIQQNVRLQKHNKVRLSTETVIRIRKALKSGMPSLALSKIYGVNYTTVQNIKTNKTWSWL